MKEYIIEFAKMKKKTEVSDEDFKKSLESIDTFLATQKGFISREIGMDEKDFWIDVVKWTDTESVKIAGENAMKSETCLKAFAAFDEKSVEMNHVIISHRFSPK